MKTLNVPLKDNSYNIYIDDDLTEKAAQFAAEGKFSKIALIVADTNTEKSYGEPLRNALVKRGVKARLFVVAAGENSKSLSTAEKIYMAASEMGLDRKSVIFAAGGGVVGDMAGFAAATYMRGVPFVQFPTTLLAQVDSSVGGKVAVNLPLGKNLVGAFYQPKAVFISLAALKTLPRREIATGLGEIIKYGVIADKELFSFLEEKGDKIYRLDKDALIRIISRSCEIKADVVSKDEKEGGLRRILNFGHTLAHAIEQETNYTRYNHGEAVAVGMAGATDISRKLGFIDEETAARIIKLIENLNLPVKAKGCRAENIYGELFRDKKTVDGKINWVLAKNIGEVFVTEAVPENIVREAIEGILE